MMREKFIKLHQIKLIDELKLKSNDIGQRIKGRTCNVTQKPAQNDPINFLIKAFHSMFRKTESWSSSGEFLFLVQILDFKHSLDAKLGLKEDQNKRFKDYVVQKVRLIKNLIMCTSFKEKEYMES